MSKKKKKRNSSNENVKIEKKEILVEDNIATKIEKNTSTERKKVKHPFVHSFLVLVLLTSLTYFIISLFYTETDSLSTLVSSLLLMIFTLLFVSVSITTNRKNKSGFFFSSLILFSYFVFGILLAFGIISFPNNKVIDFTGSSLTDAIKWANKYDVEIVQDYEYSDMIDEYKIISQDVTAGTKVKDIKNITVAVSEGPNPSKEVVVPNMVTWEAERVLDFIKKNHLSNVNIEFVQSSKAVDTVIEQSKSGNLKRDEELKLVFSYGEELGYEEVKLIDFTGKSKFEVTFYLKQHQLNYEFEEVFSSKTKKDYVAKQSIKAGTIVKVNGDKIIISISKGPKIKIPNFKKMSMAEITDWIIKNKLKLEFTDKYDDSIDENSVISANYDEGEIVAEGTVIEVVISRGKLKMPKFEFYNEFREWADKYGIKYNEEHQFSDSVAAGEVISYSYKAGDTIKNNDSIVVTISDGKEAEVPNVVGVTKNQASSKFKNAGFNCNFVYSYSDTVAEGKVIKQSISAGSKVAKNTTVTVTISKGKKPASSGSSRPSSSGSSSNSGSSNNSGGSASTPSAPATPTCSPVEIIIQSSLNGSSVANTSANYRAAYPNVKFNFVAKANAYGTTGMVHPDTTQKRVLSGTTCDTFTIYIIQN